MLLIEGLESLTTSVWGMELPAYIKLAGVKPASNRKNDMINALSDFLSNKENILGIFKNLSRMERELIEVDIRAEGYLDYSDIAEILGKSKIKVRAFGSISYNLGYGVQRYFDEKSKANLLFIRGEMPKEIRDVLEKLVKDVVINFKPVHIDIEKFIENEERKLLSIGEEFEKDLISIVKLVNSSKLKTTKASEMPNKTAMIKINEVMENKEILHEGVENIEDIRKIDNTTRVYGVCKLLLVSKVLQSNNGKLEIGNNCEEFLMMNVAEKCKFLLEQYLNSDIDELSKIQELKLKIHYEGDYSKSRKVILKYLREVPIGSWIDIKEFLSYIKKSDRKFLRNQVGEIFTYDEYDHYYYPNRNSWEEKDGRFIEVALLEYLSSIGVVDLLISEEYNEDDRLYFKVDFLRLTDLGAYVLGINDNYIIKEIKDETGIIIQPNYEIMVPEGAMKDVHCIYLDKFAEKLSEDRVNIYKISFNSIIKALDNDISVEEIIDYFEEFSQNPIPENVYMSLEQWKKESKRIKIRTVTIVETDDEYLMEELKSYKSIKNNILNELPYVFEIHSKAVNKVKRAIESKNHFCIKEE